jgi:hypothetical protein
VTSQSATKQAVRPDVQQWLDSHEPCLMINNKFVAAVSALGSY